MRDPSTWTFQNPCPFDILTTNGTPEVFTFVEPTANQAVVDFICEWDNRYTVVNHLLGNGVYSGTPPVVYQPRSDLFAKRAVITGMHGEGYDGTWVAFKYAKINVTFLTNPGGSIGGGTNTNAFISVSSEAGGEYVTVPGRQLIWDAGGEAFDNKPLEEPAQKYIPKTSHKVTVHQWLAPPFSTLDAARGKINSAAVQWVYQTIGTECLLFESYNVAYDITFSGITPFKVELTFLEKVYSWNKFLAKNGFHYYTTPSVYESTSFAGLFP